ncbi:LytR C-terminal domain-containing protein [uncultured Jatrophihabitans sp.]|uniref:LytR C-terminal domain-containing protein n=1 Tax=uncultured Jatrophihabitans sp. TaxID=1610747 RepID=UPI0035CAA487
MLVIAVIALRQPTRHVTSAKPTRTVVHTVAPPSPTSSAASSSKIAPSTISTTRPPSTTSTVTSTAGGTSELKSVPLLVLNNSTISGLARDAAQRFENAGWTVTAYGNYANNIISTCAYYDPSTANAKAAAQALQDQFPTIKRVKPRFGQLPTGPVVVVLTSDYSSS